MDWLIQLLGASLNAKFIGKKCGVWLAVKVVDRTLRWSREMIDTRSQVVRALLGVQRSPVRPFSSAVEWMSERAQRRRPLAVGGCGGDFPLGMMGKEHLASTRTVQVEGAAAAAGRAPTRPPGRSDSLSRQLGWCCTNSRLIELITHESSLPVA